MVPFNQSQWPKTVLKVLALFFYPGSLPNPPLWISRTLMPYCYFQTSQLILIQPGRKVTGLSCIRHKKNLHFFQYRSVMLLETQMNYAHRMPGKQEKITEEQI